MMNSSPTPNALSPSLAEITDEIVERLQGGEAVDLEAYVQRHPQHEQRIRELLPAMTMLAEFSHDDGDASPHELGDFRILREIGRGGMGIVYQAEQVSLKRRVALKVLPFASLLKEEQLARFKNEAFAAASLDHEHIVHAYAVGCERGVHYFAMQYVEGRNLAEVIEQLRSSHGDKAHQDNLPHEATDPAAGTTPNGAVGHAAEAVDTNGAAGRPSEADTTELGLGSTAGQPLGKEYFRTIARLIAQGAEALDYAHQRGVVHRDVKPSNLMLDGQQRLYVTDFGLAFVEGDRNLTATGDILGTIRYMSPEQAAGDTRRVDHRSDIYSLGATLYELAALRPAFSGADQLELLRRIATDDPPPVRRHNRRIPLDLETIIAKAMAKDPTERYATARDLADDLLHFAADEPISARPASIPQRMSRWTRRHSTAVLATLILLLISTLASSGAAALIWREKHRADQNAIQARASEERERDERVRAQGAERREREQREQAEAAQRQAEAMSSFLVTTLRSPDPMRGGHAVTVAEVLDWAAGTLDTGYFEDPLVTAQMHHVLGQSYVGLGIPEPALRQLEAAYELRKNSLGESHELTLASMNGLGAAYLQAGDFPKAIKLLERARALQAETLGSRHHSTLATTGNLAVTYNQAGRFNEAITLLETAIPHQREEFGDDHPNTLQMIGQLAAAYTSGGQEHKALTLYQQTLESLRSKLGADHPLTLVATNNLASALRSADQYADIIGLLEPILPDVQERYGPDHPTTLKLLTNLGSAYASAGKPAKAFELLEPSVGLLRDKVGPDHPDTLAATSALAEAYKAIGRLPKAIELREETLRVRQEKLGLDHPATLSSTSYLADDYVEAGRADDAIRLLESTWSRRQAKLGADHAATVAAMEELGVAYKTAGRISEAIKLHEDVLRIRVQKYGEDGFRTLVTKHVLASDYLAAGRLEEAIQLLEATVRLRTEKLGEDHSMTLTSINNLAAAYVRTKNVPAAIPLFEKAWKLQVKTLGEEHPDTLLTQANLGLCYREVGQLDKAIHLLESARSAYSNERRDAHSEWIAEMLFDTYVRSGQTENAIKMLDRNISRLRQSVPAGSRRLAFVLGAHALKLMNLKAWGRAEALLQECLTILEKENAEPWIIYDTKSLLGETLLEQKRPAEAEPLLLEGYHGMKSRQADIPEKSKVCLQRATTRLVRLYKTLHRPEEVETWRKLLDDMGTQQEASSHTGSPPPDPHG
jgi:serine/threonine protein kinase